MAPDGTRVWSALGEAVELVCRTARSKSWWGEGCGLGSRKQALRGRSACRSLTRVWEKLPPLTLGSPEAGTAGPGQALTAPLPCPGRGSSVGLTLPFEGRLLSQQTKDPQAPHAGTG